MKSVPHNDNEDQDIVHGAIIIFYKKEGGREKYLVVQNKETENISFVSGAKEIRDNDLSDTGKREVKEELAIDPEKYTLIPSNVTQEFVFGPKKKERAGKKAIYHVFLADGSTLGSITTTRELTSAVWMTKKEVLNMLTFDDVKDVFEKATKEIII